MTDKTEQDMNPKKNTYTVKISEIKQLFIRDFFIGEKEINFRQFYLHECGFIFGDKTVRFIKKNISAFFKISPTVEKHYVDDVFLEGTASFSDWDRLYIELFDCRYVVTNPKHSYNKLIYCGIENTDFYDTQDNLDTQEAQETLEKPVALSVIEYDSDEVIPPVNSLRLNRSTFISIHGKTIKIWRQATEKTDQCELKNLINRISILYIIAHAYVRILEKFVEEIFTEDKKRDDSYKNYLNFRMKNFRSNPIVIENSGTINNAWRFFYDYFNIEKNVEELNSIIKDYQDELNVIRNDQKEIQRKQNEKRMQRLTFAASLIAVLSIVSVANDLWELCIKIFGSDVPKAIVSIFMPGSV